MGVLGLWRLIDATGKPVSLETLEGKVLAIDISIWIHQVIQGYQDRRGNSLPNAHLIGLFNRICKLMYFKIKPIFVFDGGIPLMKKNTIATRRKLKSTAASKAHKLKNDLINNLIKHTTVKAALKKGNNDGESNAIQQFKDATAILCSPKVQDMYKLPDVSSTSKSEVSDDYVDSNIQLFSELSPRKQVQWMGNIHSVDVDTEEFKNLPADVRYDILTDLKETRKQSSWDRICELPSGLNNYSGFQVKRLLKRRYVQKSLEVAEKEMGGKTLTLEELDRLLTGQGIETTQTQNTAFRILSDSTIRVIYRKDEAASQNNNNSNDSSSSNINKRNEQNVSVDIPVDSISTHPDSSLSVINDIGAYGLDQNWYSDEDFTETFINDSHLLVKSNIPKSVMNPALAYMLENIRLTQDEIMKIVEQSKKSKKKSDMNNSHISIKSVNRTPKPLSLKHNKSKKKLFGSAIIKSPNIKRANANKVKSEKIEESNSESDDFVEVLDLSTNGFKDNIKQNKIDDPQQVITMESSKSESDDFIKIEDVSALDLSKNKEAKNYDFPVTIKVNETLQDDIFADIFTNVNSAKINELKIESEFIFDKTINNSLEKDQLENIETENFIEVKNESDKLIQENKNECFLKQFNSENLQFSDIASFSTTPKQVTPVVKEKNCSSNVEYFAVEENSEESKTEFEIQEINIEFDDDVLLLQKGNVSRTDNNEIINDDLQKINKEEVQIEKPLFLALPTDENKLESMKNLLEIEQKQITRNLGKLERQTLDITDQMRLEVQELLQLFGVPYIVAPMEAEAQCAYLEQIKLTNGTITDDSDIWLFGGRCVYKNFFNNNKRVLQFVSEDIKHHFKLSRKEMIQLALLVGSDYTNGLPGVGPVTALEILSAFPMEGEDTLQGLRNFCTWFRSGKLAAPRKTTLRNKLKNVQIEKGFPSQAVVQAYLNPTINESKESFSWSTPNLVLLADYTKKKFGWTKLKFEEIINPIMKKLMEHKNQMGITSYFKVHSVPKSIEATLSKRVQTAVQKIGGKIDNTGTSDVEVPSTSIKQKAKRSKKTASKKSKMSIDESKELPTITEDVNPESNTKLVEKIDKQSKDTSIKGGQLKFLAINEEVIPQRERDKANALRTKLRAIEIYRKSKSGLNRIQKRKKVVKTVRDDAELSESSSSS